MVPVLYLQGLVGAISISEAAAWLMQQFLCGWLRRLLRHHCAVACIAVSSVLLVISMHCSCSTWADKARMLAAPSQRVLLVADLHAPVCALAAAAACSSALHPELATGSSASWQAGTRRWCRTSILCSFQHCQGRRPHCCSGCSSMQTAHRQSSCCGLLPGWGVAKQQRQCSCLMRRGSCRQHSTLHVPAGLQEADTNSWQLCRCARFAAAVQEAAKESAKDALRAGAAAAGGM